MSKFNVNFKDWGYALGKSALICAGGYFVYEAIDTVLQMLGTLTPDTEFANLTSNPIIQGMGHVARVLPSAITTYAGADRFLRKSIPEKVCQYGLKVGAMVVGLGSLGSAINDIAPVDGKLRDLVNVMAPKANTLEIIASLGLPALDISSEPKPTP